MLKIETCLPVKRGQVFLFPDKRVKSGLFF